MFSLRIKILGGELKKLDGYFTQVNQERDHLQGALEVIMRENEAIIHARDQTIKDNSDMMEMLRDQTQATLNVKDAEINSLQDQLVGKYRHSEVCCSFMYVLAIQQVMKFFLVLGKPLK